MAYDPSGAELTRRIDAAIAEVYRTETVSATRVLGSFGAAAVDRVLELYRGSTAGPREHARLLNALGAAADDAQATARRAVARACPGRYLDRLNGHLAATEIDVIADVHDSRVTPLLITRLADVRASVRRAAALALIGRVEGHGYDDRPTRMLAEQAVLALLEDELLALRAVAAYLVASRDRLDGIVAYQQILRPTEPETVVFADVQQRIAALHRGETLELPV